MARLSLHHWLNWTIGSPERGWNDPPNRRHSRPHLETLEGRCLPSTVTNLNDAGGGSLRDAIAITPAGGMVDFQAGLSGTITLTSGALDIASNLTIMGRGTNLLTVSGNETSQVFVIEESATVAISGLTIANGSGLNGGGIQNAGTLNLTASIVSGNTALNTFEGAAGGGIYNTGTLTVSDSTLSDNNIRGGDFLTFGGGIENVHDSVLTISNSMISGNSATYGGGIDNSGTVTVLNSTFVGNNGAVGGGICNPNDLGTLAVTDSTLSGNSASSVGGGISNAGTVAVTGCTMSGNSAAGGISRSGGGIWNAGTLTLFDTIVAGNAGSPSPDLDDEEAGLTSRGHNLIGDGTGGSGYDPTDLVGTFGNPIDPKLGPLQDNGGPTLTMALLPDSPAINAGDPTNAPQWDQRGPGYPRVVNGMIDIGAYEHQAVVTTITCSVADALLWPPNHRLVNVGLSVDVQPPDATVQVQVYANDNANASDAADVGPGTLELRAARHGHGSGRVYLIVVTATSGGETAFDVCTVVVPHDQSPASVARVQAEAAGAEAYYREFQTAPPGYSLLGQGSTGAGGNGSTSLVASIGYGFRLASVAFVNPPTASSQSPTVGTVPAIDPSGNVLAAGTVVPVDGYFALGSEERGGTEADPWLPDLWLSDPVFA
jgi:hypothetical protein